MSAEVAASVFPQLEALLPHVQKPIQYVGGELNSTVKPWEATDVRWALMYPDAYEVGLPNQGRDPHLSAFTTGARTLAPSAATSSSCARWGRSPLTAYRFRAPPVGHRGVGLHLHPLPQPARDVEFTPCATTSACCA